MKSSEKIKVEAEGKIFHKHSHSYDEERFWLTTKRLIFAAICNKNEFLEVPFITNDILFLKKIRNI
jgi:hypothetical protein